MFNPYFEPCLQENSTEHTPSPSGGILDKLKTLDKDDLLMLGLIFVLARRNTKDEIWPLVAVMLYCLLGN